jgi:hypothetical protein
MTDDGDVEMSVDLQKATTEPWSGPQTYGGRRGPECGSWMSRGSVESPVRQQETCP